jgi:hypothetical protein
MSSEYVNGEQTLKIVVVRFEALTAVVMKISAFWHVMALSLIGIYHLI